MRDSDRQRFKSITKDAQYMNFYCSVLLLLSGLMPMMVLTAHSARSVTVDPPTQSMCRADEPFVAS